MRCLFGELLYAEQGQITVYLEEEILLVYKSNGSDFDRDLFILFIYLHQMEAAIVQLHHAVHGLPLLASSLVVLVDTPEIWGKCDIWEEMSISVMFGEKSGESVMFGEKYQ